MSEWAIEGWDPQRRVDAGIMLAAVLRREPERAHAIASGLAPDKGSGGIRYERYEGTIDSAKRSAAYQVAFANLDAFLKVLVAGDPGALELGLVIASEIEPDIGVAVARVLIPRGPWKMLGRALGRALGKARSEESFSLLLDSPRTPYLRDGLRDNTFAGGVERAWAAYHAVGGLDRAGLTPQERVDTEPVLSYLVRHDLEHAFVELVRLVRERGDTSFVAHTLAGIGTEEAHAVLFDELARAQPGASLTFAQRLAVRLLLDKDPASTVDALGGAAFLGSPEGRPRLVAVLGWLRDDTWRIKKGWLAADPRFAELCAGLAGDADRSLAALARDLVRTLPREQRPKRGRRAKKSPPVQAPPEPELVREIEELRAALEQLRAHLAQTKYRFAAPRRSLVAPTKADLKALARLEKTVVVPAALAAFWRSVGSVDLRGQHRRWPVTSYLGFAGAKEPVWLTDPLVIAPAAHVIAQAFEEHGEPPLALHLGPDAIGKAGYSGGMLTLWLPQEGPDPELDDANETLLAHLRRALAWAGFPGFAAIEDRPEDWLAAARASLG